MSPSSVREHKPKVIYVLGAHRSGSTVLGVTLGNCDDVFFAGELHSWFSRKGVPSFGGAEGQRLWREVSEQVEGAEELFGHETQLYIDRSSALFRVHRWPARRRLLGRYRRMTEALIQAVSNSAHARFIVDTSHYPPRANQLRTMPGIDMYLLFLVRDPQDIIASFDPHDTTSGSKGLVNANLYLLVTYLLSLIAFLRHPREQRLLVRHEDFLADPRTVLRQILDGAGCDSSLPDLTSLETGSPLQGNRFLKSSEVIALRGPTTRRTQKSLLTALVQFAWKPIFKRLRPACAISASSGRDPAPEPRAA